MPSPTPEETVYTVLVLLSLAVRPLPDGTSPDFIQLDRAALWRLAEAAGARVGRNKFHALTAELAEEAPDAIEVHRRRGNRWTVVLVPAAADPDSWLDEVLEPLGLADVPAAIEAATALGIDTTTALPADVLQAPPADDEDDGDQDDAEAAELTAKVCTRCQEEKPADAFSERARPSARLSSWCRACSNTAVREWRERRRPAGAPRLAAPADRRTSATAWTTGEKVCTGCRRRRPLAHFHHDASRHDGHAVRCKSCRSDAAYQVSLFRFTDV